MSERNSEINEIVALTYDGEVAILRLGAPSERIAVLTKERMQSLSSALGEIESRPGLRGVVITGASAHGFCAGADLEEIRCVTVPSVGESLARAGQELFARIEKLPLITVALIRGACVGGGCELVLSCKHRLISAGDDSKIGLPEVKLGILPGFGGTQRLPRLIGVPRALDIILKGRVVGAKDAHRFGMADMLLPENMTIGIEERFAAQLKTAVDIASGRSPIRRRSLPLKDRFVTFTSLGRKLARSQIDKSVEKETKGQYPAPSKAVAAVFEGLRRGLEAGYVFEARALGELVVTPACKALVHLFRISEASGKLGRAAAGEVNDKRIAVIGAGVMGAGIASVFLSRGHRVTIIDSFPGALEKGRAHVQSYIHGRRHLSEEKKHALLDALSVQSELSGEAAFSDLFIEAVIEDLDVKRKLFQEVAKAAKPDALLATNTSSLSVTRLSDHVSSPERFLGVHFFNPVEKMPLVEIVRTEKTDGPSILRAAALASNIGKYPIVVEDVPGFLVNRILTPYLGEAGVLLRQGVPVTEIDRAAALFGMPMGPIRLLDEVGLDIAAKVAEMLEEGYGERMKNSGLVEALLKAGRKGKKSGSGFYLYEGDSSRPDPELTRLLDLPKLPDETVLTADLTDRLILPMVNEAVLCLDEGVAGRPGAEAAAQIDLGSVMGTGFPPFRGGLLHYADFLGAQKLKTRLEELSARYGKRFAPCAGIVNRAASGASFHDEASDSSSS